MRSESTSAFGQPSDTKPTRGTAGASDCAAPPVLPGRPRAGGNAYFSSGLLPEVPPKPGNGKPLNRFWVCFCICCCISTNIFALCSR